MLTTVFLFVKSNRWTWYVGGALALLLAFLAFRSGYIHVGKGIGKEEQRQEDKTAVQTANKEDKASVSDSLSESNRKIAEQDAALRVVLPEVQRLGGQISSLQQQLRTAQDNARNVPKADTHDYVRRLLNPSRTPPPAACYLPEEEEKIAEAVASMPACEALSSKTQEQQQKTDAAIQALTSRMQEVEGKYTTLYAYNSRLEQRYVFLYNQNPPRKRSIKCFGIWKCVKDPIKADPLEAIKKAAP